MRRDLARRPGLPLERRRHAPGFRAGFAARGAGTSAFPLTKTHHPSPTEREVDQESKAGAQLGS